MSERLKEYFDIHEVELSEGNYSNIQFLEEKLDGENRILSVTELTKNSLLAVTESTYKEPGDYIRICVIQNNFFKKGGLNIPKKSYIEFCNMISESKDNLLKDETIK